MMTKDYDLIFCFAQIETWNSVLLKEIKRMYLTLWFIFKTPSNNYIFEVYSERGCPFKIRIATTAIPVNMYHSHIGLKQMSNICKCTLASALPQALQKQQAYLGMDMLKRGWLGRLGENNFMMYGMCYVITLPYCRMASELVSW